jgi:ABC-type phosphate transport system substrate-binding protein
VVVGAGNSVTNLTREQVRDIFTGVVQNWKGVGGADAPIHLYARDPISGTALGFKELAMENKPYTPDPKMFTLHLYTSKAAETPATTASSSLSSQRAGGRFWRRWVTCRIREPRFLFWLCLKFLRILNS